MGITLMIVIVYATLRVILTNCVPVQRKYGLLEYFESYIRFNVFPSKNIWKRLVKSRIHDNEVNSWHIRLSAPDFNRFRQLHTEYSPHTLWIESRSPVIYSQ